MTNEEFTNIYYTGLSKHVKEAIVEMNKTFTMSECAKILQTSYSNLRNTCRRLGISANKKVARKSVEKKWNTLINK